MALAEQPPCSSAVSDDALLTLLRLDRQEQRHYLLAGLGSPTAMATFLAAAVKGWDGQQRALLMMNKLAAAADDQGERVGDLSSTTATGRYLITLANSSSENNGSSGRYPSSRLLISAWSRLPGEQQWTRRWLPRCLGEFIEIDLNRVAIPSAP